MESGEDDGWSDNLDHSHTSTANWLGSRPMPLPIISSCGQVSGLLILPQIVKIGKIGESGEDGVGTSWPDREELSIFDPSQGGPDRGPPGDGCMGFSCTNICRYTSLLCSTGCLYFKMRDAVKMSDSDNAPGSQYWVHQDRA